MKEIGKKSKENGLHAIVAENTDSSNAQITHNKYYNYYQNSPDMMVSVDCKTGTIADCNRALVENLGCDRGSVIGTSMLNLFAPESHENAKSAYENFLQTGRIKNEKLLLKTKDEAFLNVALSSEAIRDEEGNITHSNSILRNISDLVYAETQLKLANQKLESRLSESQKFLTKVTEIAPSIIYVFNQLTMSNDYTNKEIGTVLGYSELEIKEMGEKLIPMLCHEDDLNRVFEHFGIIQGIRDDESVSVEYRMKNKSGSYRWLLSEDAVFERGAKGEVAKHIGVATDVTQIKESEQKLKDQSLVLEARNKDLEQLTHLATHDLRSPMISIQGHFDYVKQNIGEVYSEVQESLNFIESGINQFNQTADSLYKALEIKETSIAIERVDLSSLLEGSCSLYHTQISEVGGSLHSEIQQGVFLESSNLYLNSVIENLISNAIKYRNPENKLEIKVTLCQDPKHISITIEDNGLGIDLELHKDRIFKMFNRFHDHTDGKGIGLYLVKTMIDRLGGDLEIHSKVKKGMSLNIKLPR